MTREEIISRLKFTIEMFLIDPNTGETYTEPRNDMDKTTIDACKGAIELLEKESTTKNDLAVERQIKEICISYPKSNLKEHDGKPYYTIKYIENGKEYQGYGTYKIEVFMEYLKNYFMPSVTPQLSSATRKNSKKLENASPIIDWNNCHTSDQIDSIATTKDDLAVDCIDRQAAITFSCKNTKEILKDTMPLEVKLSHDYIYENVAKIMRNPKVLPPATPIRPKGHWIRVSKDKLKCSECDVIHFIAQYPLGKIDWCPNCGADMREVVEE